jgi:hypothetical protein
MQARHGYTKESFLHGNILLEHKSIHFFFAASIKILITMEATHDIVLAEMVVRRVVL